MICAQARAFRSMTSRPSSGSAQPLFHPQNVHPAQDGIPAACAVRLAEGRQEFVLHAAWLISAGSVLPVRYREGEDVRDWPMSASGQRFFQGNFGPMPLGEVAHDPGRSHHVAGGVLDPVDNNDRDVQLLPVLERAHRFEMIHPLAAPDAGKNLRFLRSVGPRDQLA